MRTGVYRIAALAIAAAICVGGCGSARPSSVGQSARRTPAARKSTPPPRASIANGECTTALYGSAVQVTLIGDFTRACDEWDREWSSKSSYWHQIELAGGEDPSERLICSIEVAGVLVEVRDDDAYNAEQGSSVCGSLVAGGFPEVPYGPGYRREQRREQREARELAEYE